MRPRSRPHSQQVQNAVLGCSLKNNGMISVCSQGKWFSIIVIQVYAPKHSCWRNWSWLVVWGPKRPSRTNTKKRCPFHHRVLGATTGDPTYDKVLWKSHDEQGGSWLKRFPRSAGASTPKPESVCLTILCLSPTLLTLTGGYPRPPFSGKSQLRALINKSPGHERNISILTLLLAF